jgi:hypothetical protein
MFLRAAGRPLWLPPEIRLARDPARLISADAAILTSDIDCGVDEIHVLLFDGARTRSVAPGIARKSLADSALIELASAPRIGNSSQLAHPVTVAVAGGQGG